MIQAVKKQFQVQMADWIWMIVVIVGANIFGQVIHGIMIRTDKTPETCFALGTVMSLMMVLIFLLITTFSQLTTYFNVEISMGCTRWHFFISYYIFCAIFGVASVFICMGLNLLENKILEILYPTLPNEIYFMPYLVKYGIVAAALIPMVSIFCGTLMMRYGRKVFWVIWAIYMFAVLGVPSILEHAEEAPNTLYGRIGTVVIGIFGKIPVSVWICLGGIVVVVSFVGSWMLLRKQQVTV